MIVRVKLMSDLRKYLRGRPEPLCCELARGAVVADLVDQLGIPPDEEMIVGVNGQLGDPASQLADGDEVMLLTPMAGGAGRPRGPLGPLDQGGTGRWPTATGTACCVST